MSSGPKHVHSPKTITAIAQWCTKCGALREFVPEREQWGRWQSPGRRKSGRRGPRGRQLGLAFAAMALLAACAGGSSAGSDAGPDLVRLQDGGLAERLADGGLWRRPDLDRLDAGAVLELDAGARGSDSGDAGELLDQVDGSAADAAGADSAVDAGPAVNSCGGSGRLSHEPGSLCWDLVGQPSCMCGSGFNYGAVWLCEGTDAVRCECRCCRYDAGAGGSAQPCP